MNPFLVATVGAGYLLYKYFTSEPTPRANYQPTRNYGGYGHREYYYDDYYQDSYYRPSTSTSTVNKPKSSHYKPESYNAGNSIKKETIRPTTTVVRSLTLLVTNKQSGWDPIPANHENYFVTLDTTHREYIEIMNLFHSKMPRSRSKISRIERVQNPYLMGRYQMKKSELKTRVKNVEEKLVFHGTKKVNVESICKDNFNWRFNGQGTGHRFGQGVSFSPKSCYSENYCDKGKKAKQGKVMIVARIMIGVTCVGSGNMIIPGYWDKLRKIRYDTTVKDVKNDDVVVKYSDDEYYPAYVIHFTADPIKNYKKPVLTVSK
ncbi:hypothetical protein CBL_08313 [Carabus blaptoides fortunei]